MSEPSTRPVLGIHTAEERLALAIVSGDRVLSRFDESAGTGRSRHAELLSGAIQQVWFDAGLPRGAVLPVAVVVGPGSFTGVRTALAWAKGYAMARQAPLVTLGTLEALAFQGGEPGRVAVWQDARRGEVFAAVYRREGAVLELIEPERCLEEATWLSHLETLEQTGPLCRVGAEVRLLPDSVARLGVVRLAAGGQDDPVTAHPRYLREASATPNWRPLAHPLEERA